MVAANPNAERSVGILQCGEVPESLSHAFIDYNEMIAKSLVAADPTLTQKGWGVGVATSSVYEQPAWMSQAVDELNLVVSHQEQVITLPENATLVAGSDFCPHSIFSVGQSMLGIQGHPEFTTEYSRALMEARREIIPADRVSEGMDSGWLEVDLTHWTSPGHLARI